MSLLAHLLETHAENLLRRWSQRLGESLTAHDQTAAQLGEHAPALLRDLGSALRDGRTPDEYRAARAHGRQRHQTGFDLDALVREYGILSSCILTLAQESGTAVTLPELRVLTDFITHATAEAVSEHDEQRRDAELALAEVARASENHLRLVVDAIPLLISVVTAEERYGLINKAYEQWFGIPRASLLGKTLIEVVGEAAYKALDPYVRRGLAGERVTFEQHGVPYRFGGIRDVKVDFVPHQDAAGNPNGYIAVLQDITAERRWAAERERLARQRREVLESMGDAFFSLDRDWRITLINRRYEQLSGKDREQTLGRIFWEAFPEAAEPSSHYFQEYHRCMREQVPVQFLDYYPALDLWMDVRAYPTPEGGIAVFFRDVTKQRQAEAMLKRQSEFEQQLIGIVSHDLRNPLNVIQLGAALLADREGLDARAKKTVARIEASATRAIRLVSDLLDFTQARLGGGIRIAPLPAELHELTRVVVEEVEAAYPTRKVELHQSGDGQGHWDADRISQVVQNLVTNALKYSPDGTPVQVMTDGAADFVTLSVHNHGTPIPAARIDNIFQPMQRGTDDVDKAGRSVGLGLYIVQSIVAAHRGRISVTSATDAGTTFTVWLPRQAGALA